MNVVVSLPQVNYRMIVIDLVILLTIYFIPTLSHTVPFSLHLVEPMRLLLFLGLLITRNHLNTYFLALTIPFVSTIIAGHPPFAKAILISVELFTNAWLLILLTEKLKWNDGLAFFLSIVASKTIYYGLKFLFLKLGWVQGGLISTPLAVQWVAVAALTILYAIATCWLRNEPKQSA